MRVSVGLVSLCPQLFEVLAHVSSLVFLDFSIGIANERHFRPIHGVNLRVDP